MDLLKLNAFPSVPATGTASVTSAQCLGYAIHGIVLERGGTTFTNAQISAVRARINNKDVVNLLSGAQLVAMNDYEGFTDVTNYTFLFFGDPSARTVRGQHLGDLDCSIYNYPVTIEVDIAGATAPTLQAYALVSVPKLAMGIGYTQNEAAIIRALVRTQIQPAGAVSRNAYGISIGSSAGARIRRVWFFNANLTSVDLQKQSLRKWDDVSSALNSAVAQQYVRTPQAGLYVLDRILDGNQGEAETTVSPNGQQWNIQVALTTSAADTINAFADIFTTLPGL